MALNAPSVTTPAAAVVSFSFAAAGSIGSSANAAATLTRLGASGTNFFLALGDLSLNGTGSEPRWCNFVTSRVGTSYPFELLSGDNEDNGPNGLIDNFTACLPDRIGGLNGTYGKEYFFDYPSLSPLARFIEVSPALTFTNGGSYSYSVANAHFKWLSAAIDDARAKGIPWVIVSMHKFCFSVSTGSCDVGQDLTDLLTAKRVDLVLEAHGIDYQRSKQLTCAVRTFYVPECVAGDGSSGTYLKGAGTVFVDAGTGGAALQATSTTDTEYPYMVPSGIMGSKTPGAGFGYVTFAVSSSRIDVATSFSKTYQDHFSLAAGTPPPAPAPTLPSPRVPFTFTAVGDIGVNSGAASTLARIPSANANFSIALGDLSYNGTGSEPAWCSFVSSRVGATYPFELISGNHEDNGPDGLIDNFTKCLPDRIGGLNGTYGKEYSFDYPATNPLARFILISPAMTFTFGGTYSYSVANSHYTWLAKRIDDARAKGIPWVIVGFHEYCIAVGGTCGVGQDLQDLLSAKRVDLVLGGHFHVYERSKDLTCGIRSFYVPQCVSSTGSNGFYPKGTGTVFSLIGTGGGPLGSISKSDVSYPYFAALMGSNTPGSGTGSMVYTVRPDRIDAASQFSGTYADRYTIATPLAADFGASPSTTDAGAPVSFTAVAAGGKTPYTPIWDFGDGTKGTDMSVSHAFAAAGSYNVTLQLYDALGTIATVTHSVVVNPALAGAFTFAPAGPAAGDGITFTGTESGGTAPFAYAWDFGDGTTAAGPQAIHAYAGGGTYTITLNVTDGAGQRATASGLMTVTPALTAGFTSSPPTPATGDGMNFTGAAAGGTGPYAFAWDFGDGSQGIGPTATHAYASSGTYAVTLTVSDSSGHTASATATVTVTAPLTAALIFTPTSPTVGDTVTFNGTASGGTGPYSCTWDFGDGNGSAGCAATHAYGSAGSFLVTLTVADAADHNATATATLVVAAALSANFTVNPSSPAAGDNVTFNSTATGGSGAYTFTWDFGDGNVSAGDSVAHAFAVGGTYIVVLTVTDAQGHVVQVAKTVTVA